MLAEIARNTFAIPLNHGYSVVVDKADFERLNIHRWRVLKSKAKRYAVRSQWFEGKYKSVLMHRDILGAENGIEVDHRNGDGLDNRRGNLRLATRQQNAANWRGAIVGRSRFKGVYRDSDGDAWVAQIGGGCSDGKQKVTYLGSYDAEEDAAIAYNRAAIERSGEFAAPNSILDDGRELVRRRPVPVPKRGEDNHFAKLTRLQAIEVKRRALLGERVRVIAGDYGVSTQLVYAIKNGHAWSDLPPDIAGVLARQGPLETP